MYKATTYRCDLCVGISSWTNRNLWSTPGQSTLNLVVLAGWLGEGGLGLRACLGHWNWKGGNPWAGDMDEEHHINDWSEFMGMMNGTYWLLSMIFLLMMGLILLMSSLHYEFMFWWNKHIWPHFHPSILDSWRSFAIILALSKCHSIGRGDPCLHPKVVGRQRLGEGDGSDRSDNFFCEK